MKAGMLGLALVLATGAVDAQAPFDGVSWTSLEAAFAAEAAGGFSGVVLARRAGTRVMHRAFGIADREAGRAMTLDAAFDIGSTPINFTMTAVAPGAGGAPAAGGLPWATSSRGACGDAGDHHPSAGRESEAGSRTSCTCASADVWGRSIVRMIAEDHPTIRYVSPRGWIRSRARRERLKAAPAPRRTGYTSLVTVVIPATGVGQP